jgi:hypothetical protein
MELFLFTMSFLCLVGNETPTQAGMSIAFALMAVTSAVASIFERNKK